MTTTDTPRTDSCPHCGAEWELPEKMFACGTPVSPVLPSGRISEAFCSELCEERSTRQKLEAEVERLTKLTEDCLNVIRVYCPTYYQDAMERFNKTNK